MQGKSSARPLKICFITDSYWPTVGGVEQWVHAIASNLSSQYTVTVITQTGADPVSPFHFFLRQTDTDRLDDAGNRVVTFAPSPLGRLRLAPLLLWHFPFVKRLFPKVLFDGLYIFYKMAFRKKLDNALSGAELVHCFSTGYLAAWATEACLSKAIPLIHSPPVHFGKWGDSPLLLQSYAKANAIVCLSQSFKHEFQRLLPQARVPVYVNPAPVSLSKNKKEPSLPVPNPFILFLGRREKHKGLTVLLSAFKKILPPASLVVAGPGRPVSPEDPRIIDLGFVDEAIKNWLLDNCALLCVPSYEESFGIVFVEAMAHAKPVVAFDIAPVNEIIVHGETGLLIPAGETKEISAAIRALLNGPASAQRMGNNGYKRYCEVYEGKKVMKKIMSLYDSIVSS